MIRVSRVRHINRGGIDRASTSSPALTSWVNEIEPFPFLGTAKISHYLTTSTPALGSAVAGDLKQMLEHETRIHEQGGVEALDQRRVFTPGCDSTGFVKSGYQT